MPLQRGNRRIRYRNGTTRFCGVVADVRAAAVGNARTGAPVLDDRHLVARRNRRRWAGCRRPARAEAAQPFGRWATRSHGTSSGRSGRDARPDPRRADRRRKNRARAASRSGSTRTVRLNAIAGGCRSGSSAEGSRRTSQSRAAVDGLFAALAHRILRHRSPGDVETRLVEACLQEARVGVAEVKLAAGCVGQVREQRLRQSDWTRSRRARTRPHPPTDRPSLRALPPSARHRGRRNGRRRGSIAGG